MATLSVLLICLNEEANIQSWLDSVKPFADQIVAVDSGSTDGTVEMLEKAGALVKHRDWSGYSDQRNYAASLCTGDWVVILDADEWVDEELCDSLNKLKTRPDPTQNAFEICAKVFFFRQVPAPWRFFSRKASAGVS
jgi:glycosyltransferase involved in cell wall biosynthesis